MERSVPALEDEDSDWEYEYHPTETEDHYVILDIPSKESSNEISKSLGVYTGDVFSEYRVVHPRYAGRTGSKRRRRNPVTGELELHQDDDEEEVPDAEHRTTRPLSVLSKIQAPLTEGRMQIMGLHEDSPVVAYGGDFYTCEWATTIGTDMIFVKHQDASAQGLEPARRIGTWDLVGQASVRLIGTRAQVNIRTSNDIDQADEDLQDDFGSMEVDDARASFWQKLTEVRIENGEINFDEEPLDQQTWETLLLRDNPSLLAPRGRGRRGRPKGSGKGKGSKGGRGTRGTANSISSASSPISIHTSDFEHDFDDSLEHDVEIDLGSKFNHSNGAPHSHSNKRRKVD